MLMVCDPSSRHHEREITCMDDSRGDGPGGGSLERGCVLDGAGDRPVWIEVRHILDTKRGMTGTRRWRR